MKTKELIEETEREIEKNKRDLFLTQDNAESQIEHIIKFLYGEMGEENILLLKLEQSKAKLEGIKQGAKTKEEEMNEIINECKKYEGRLFERKVLIDVNELKQKRGEEK